MSKKGQKTPKDARKTPKSIFPQLLWWNLFCGVRYNVNELYYAQKSQPQIFSQRKYNIPFLIEGGVPTHLLELLPLQQDVVNESPTHGPQSLCCLYRLICFSSSSSSTSLACHCFKERSEHKQMGGVFAILATTSYVVRGHYDIIQVICEKICGWDFHA